MAQDLFDIISVECREGHLLLLRFEDGVEGVFDMSPWMVRKPYEVLANPSVFNEAQVAFGTVVWPGGIDIDPETLRNGVKSISPDTVSDADEGVFLVAEAPAEYDAPNTH